MDKFFPQVYDRFVIGTSPPDEDVQCTLHAAPHDLFRGPTVGDLEGIRRSWTIEMVFRSSTNDDVEMELSQLRMRLVADDVALEGLADSSLLDLGRITEAHMYNDWVLGGLTDCLVRHGKRCKAVMNGLSVWNLLPSPLQGPQKGLRLIDVHANKIVDARAACDYVALSYVWGHTNSLLLLQHTQDDLYSAAGLSKFKVPQTIADAIEVVKRLGQQYLWVDALCIQQDNEADKTLEILRMDSVYSNAIATIVAAAGDHADAGLCGVGPSCPRRTQIVVGAQGFRFTAASPSFANLLNWHRSRMASNPWATRAWTYQEYRLSRRMLIFTLNNVMWKCSSSELHEDWVSEVLGDGTEVSESWAKRWAEEQTIVDEQCDYPRLISQYGARRMTYESDGLNAISSVLSVYGSATQDGMLYGIPVSTLLEQGLFWFPHSASPGFRRRGESQLGRPFPSWSWVGWVGPVWYVEFRERASDVKRGARVIETWALEHPNGCLHSASLHFPGAVSPMTRPQGLEGCQNDVLKLIQTGMLCMQAQISQFIIATEPWAQFGGSRDVECTWTGLYKVFLGDLWLGTVHLMHEIRQELGEGYLDHGLHTFIALSQSVDPDDDVWEIEDNRFDPDADPNWVKPYDTALEEVDDGHVFNVLLVRKDQMNYIRQGIGQIHRASWKQSACRTQQVRLA